MRRRGFIKTVSGKQAWVETTRGRGGCQSDRQRGEEQELPSRDQDTPAAPSRGAEKHGNGEEKENNKHFARPRTDYSGSAFWVERLIMAWDVFPIPSLLRP